MRKLGLPWDEDICINGLFCDQPACPDHNGYSYWRRDEWMPEMSQQEHWEALLGA